MMEESMTSEEPKTPEQYFQIGRVWLDAAEDMAEGNQDAATLAILSMASALPVSYTHLTLPTNREV